MATLERCGRGWSVTKVSTYPKFVTYSKMIDAGCEPEPLPKPIAFSEFSNLIKQHANSISESEAAKEGEEGEKKEYKYHAECAMMDHLVVGCELKYVAWFPSCSQIHEKGVWACAPIANFLEQRRTLHNGAIQNAVPTICGDYFPLKKSPHDFTHDELEAYDFGKF